MFFDLWFFTIFSEPLGKKNAEKSKREKYFPFCTSKKLVYLQLEKCIQTFLPFNHISVTKTASQTSQGLQTFSRSSGVRLKFADVSYLWSNLRWPSDILLRSEGPQTSQALLQESITKTWDKPRVTLKRYWGPWHVCNVNLRNQVGLKVLIVE